MHPDSRSPHPCCRSSSSRPVSLLTLLDSRNVAQPHDDDASASRRTVAAGAATAAPPFPTAAAAPPLETDAGPSHEAPAATADRSSFDYSSNSLEIRRSKKQRNWPAKSKVLELLNELLDEMDLSEHAIVSSAQQHIHANEVILTFGLSQTILNFLKNAAEKRKFQVSTHHSRRCDGARREGFTVIFCLSTPFAASTYAVPVPVSRAILDHRVRTLTLTLATVALRRTCRIKA